MGGLLFPVGEILLLGYFPEAERELGGGSFVSCCHDARGVLIAPNRHRSRWRIFGSDARFFVCACKDK